MAVSRLDHYTIRTPDLEVTRRFYIDVVGLTAGPRPPFAFPGLWLYCGDPGVPENAVVHVVGIDAADVERAHAPKADSRAVTTGLTGAVDHVAFAAAGFAEMRTKLERMGVPHRVHIVPLTGVQQIFLEDPSGIVLELNYAAHEREAR